MSYQEVDEDDERSVIRIRAKAGQERMDEEVAQVRPQYERQIGSFKLRFIMAESGG